MKVEMSVEELKVLMAPGTKAQENVVILEKEVTRLNAMLTVVEAGPADNTNHLANVLTNVCSALAAGNKISAIKLVREFTRLGLREAKDIVEGNYSGPGVTRVI